MKNASISVNLHNPAVVAVSELDPGGTVCVNLGDFPLTASLFFEGAAELSAFGRTLVNMAKRLRDDQLAKELSA
jgi:hypothetical protein